MAEQNNTGGLPLAALGGQAQIMDMLAPIGPVYQAGTLSGNPIATAAANEASSRLQPASCPKVRTASAKAPAAAHPMSARGPKLNSTPNPAAATAPKNA